MTAGIDAGAWFKVAWVKVAWLDPDLAYLLLVAARDIHKGATLLSKPARFHGKNLHQRQHVGYVRAQLREKIMA